MDAEIIPSLAEPGNAGGAIAKKEFANTQIERVVLIILISRFAPSRMCLFVSSLSHIAHAMLLRSLTKIHTR